MIAIVQCCGNNIASLQYALQRIGAGSTVTVDPKIIKKASHVILPGVGHAHYAMTKLKENNLIEVIQNLTQPVLGICLGMQLFYTSSEEGNTTCLGIIPEKIAKLPAQRDLSLPHTGWNTLNNIFDHPFINNSGAAPYVYFVHNYYAPIGKWTLSKTHYGIPFTSMVRYHNFLGMQFHPEKSSQMGELLLTNFIKMST